MNNLLSLITKCILILAFLPQLSLAELQEDSWAKNKVRIDRQLLTKEKEHRRKHKSPLASSDYYQEIQLSTSQYSSFIFERFSDSPQAYFLFNYGSYKIIGRKYLSDLVVNKGLPGLFCSKITPDMILGIYEKDRLSEQGILIEYKSLPDKDKSAVFSKLLHDRNIAIWYPYVQLIGDTKQEKSTPEEGWVIDEGRANFLGMGEAEIRNYTISFLKEWAVHNKMKGAKIYDPACSTGQFLENIKKHFPETVVIGQDLSKSMVGYAKPKLDMAYHGDALNPMVDKNSIDIVFYRFLNGEVVTSANAYDLFNAVSRVVKPGGILILLGHTPILIDTKWIEAQGYINIKQNGITQDNTGVFQYIVMQKPKNQKVKKFINPLTTSVDKR